MNFVLSTQIGEPVDAGEPDRVARPYVGPGGTDVVVLREARGREVSSVAARKATRRRVLRCYVETAATTRRWA